MLDRQWFNETDLVMTAYRPKPNHYVKEIYSFEVPSSTEWATPSTENMFLPNRFVDVWCALELENPERFVASIKDDDLISFAKKLKGWRVVPSGTQGYKKAEVTRGGVSTSGLSSKTMEAKTVSGLFFIGEVVDVTGWLGGYNFQWAWASANACAEAL